MAHRYFIISTGTDIGKTYVTAALTAAAKRLGKTVMAFKPVVTGVASSTDTAVLMESLGLAPTSHNVEQISPWRYDAPLAPSMAARLENRMIRFEELVAWTERANALPYDVVLTETTGGLMVPLNDDKTMLEWTSSAAVPTILVTGSYLGTISHTLTALKVLAHEKIPLAALVLNETEGSSVNLEATRDELKRWTKAPVYVVARAKNPDGWRSLSQLNGIFED